MSEGNIDSVSYVVIDRVLAGDNRDTCKGATYEMPVGSFDKERYGTSFRVSEIVKRFDTV